MSKASSVLTEGEKGDVGYMRKHIRVYWENNHKDLRSACEGFSSEDILVVPGYPVNSKGMLFIGNIAKRGDLHMGKIAMTTYMQNRIMRGEKLLSMDKSKPKYFQNFGEKSLEILRGLKIEEVFQKNEKDLTFDDCMMWLYLTTERDLTIALFNTGFAAQDYDIMSELQNLACIGVIYKFNASKLAPRERWNFLVEGLKATTSRKIDHSQLLDSLQSKKNQKIISHFLNVYRSCAFGYEVGVSQDVAVCRGHCVSRQKPFSCWILPGRTSIEKQVIAEYDNFARIAGVRSVNETNESQKKAQSIGATIKASGLPASTVGAKLFELARGKSFKKKKEQLQKEGERSRTVESKKEEESEEDEESEEEVEALASPASTGGNSSTSSSSSSSSSSANASTGKQLPGVQPQKAQKKKSPKEEKKKGEIMTGESFKVTILSECMKAIDDLGKGTGWIKEAAASMRMKEISLAYYDVSLNPEMNLDNAIYVLLTISQNKVWEYIFRKVTDADRTDPS